MVQGGDPLGTGKGGESIWGGTFPDEFHQDNKHDKRGMVSSISPSYTVHCALKHVRVGAACFQRHHTVVVSSMMWRFLKGLSYCQPNLPHAGVHGK